MLINLTKLKQVKRETRSQCINIFFEASDIFPTIRKHSFRGALKSLRIFPFKAKLQSRNSIIQFVQGAHLLVLLSLLVENRKWNPFDM